ncbi:MAG: LysR family transcriptional regulator [Clostridia bacterium]|nr:LysR family transcriptional regulator [Clostridia bacterium]
MIDKIALYRSFLEVARCSSISLASKTLYKTQPAISTEIMSLEKALGVKLFLRTNRGMVLTPEGKVLYEHVKGAFSLIEAGEGAMSDITGMQKGLLRIGASDMTLRFYLLDHIISYRNKYPGIKIAITNNPTPQTLAALHNGTIDFGVVSEPISEYLSASDSNDIETVPVRQIRDIFVCSPDCPLASASSVSGADISNYPVIMLESQTSTRRYLRTQSGFENLEADIELATSGLLIEFARRGMGVASVVEDFALDAIASGELCRIDLAEPPKPRNFLLVYRKKMTRTSAAKMMLTQLREETEYGSKQD